MIAAVCLGINLPLEVIRGHTELGIAHDDPNTSPRVSEESHRQVL